MKGSGRHGISGWSIHHPVGTTMIALAMVVLGLFALLKLSVDLLPQLSYPEVRVRIIDPGVPASIMEDRITRQLEEQLAITEDAIRVVSETVEGASRVDLSFEYGKDIDIALRDASTRLDRAKRFLPDSIDPPVIYKLDPSQLPAIELVVASAELDTQHLRDWVDYEFSKQFLNLPGVAAVEVGGGMVREIQVLPDQQRLAASGLSIEQLSLALQRANIDLPAGRLSMADRELSGRTAARFESVAAIAELPIRLADGTILPLRELAQVIDGHGDARIGIRLNGEPGIKVSIQKQPGANTINVVDAVTGRLDWLRSSQLIPEKVTITPVADQARYVRNALDNATLAAISGTLLAMAVVYLFLGNLRRTLIIGSAIPLGIVVTFILMGFGGLTFNIMTLGGLALGVGMLVDNTIVMLENIQRHQQAGEGDIEAGHAAAGEIHGAIIASTSTNLAAVLPFLFVGGLVGLLFRELIFTISAAILASMVVALTLVPALAVRVHGHATSPLRRHIDAVVAHLQRLYGSVIATLLQRNWLQLLVLLPLCAGLYWATPNFIASAQQFLPQLDDGQIRVTINADPGTSLGDMDRAMRRIEALIATQPEVENQYSIIGGSVFGRSIRETSNQSSLRLQLVPRNQRTISSKGWIKQVTKEINRLNMAGVRVRMRTVGIRGVRVGSGSDELALRIQGPDLDTLTQLGNEVVARLKSLEGLRNLEHSLEQQRQELTLHIDRARSASLGLDAERIGRALQQALNGEVVTEYLEGDRAIDVRLRLPHHNVANPYELEQLILFPEGVSQPLRLGSVASLKLSAAPAEIQRENQRRMIEISASLAEGVNYGSLQPLIRQALDGLALPSGYSLYDAGELEALEAGSKMGQLLLGLALFLVFVVMAVKYESLRNPLVIMLAVPFTTIGVALGLKLLQLPLSMPVWLGMIMLAGIVVNNSIVLVEYIEVLRRRGEAVTAAIVEAARLRLRPILMTTLTTVVGMLPLGIGIGEGGEMLQPLAIALISGLSMSLLVTLLLIPILYHWFHRGR